MRARDILGTIGNTPHVRINRLYGKEHQVWIKLEKNNPGASIKDRIALSMIEDAEQNGIHARNFSQSGDGVFSKQHGLSALEA